MKKYVLRKSGFGYCFSDPKRGSENEVFHSREHGARILTEMIRDKRISLENANALLDEIIQLPNFPIYIPEEKLSVERILKREMIAIKLLLHLKHIIEKYEEIQQYKVPTFVLCGCKQHASILGDGIISPIFFSKVDGLAINEILKDEGKFDYARFLILKKDIEESELPDEVKVVDPNQN